MSNTEKKKSFWSALFVVCAVIAIIALSILCWYLYRLYNDGRENSDLQSINSAVSANTSDYPDIDAVHTDVYLEPYSQIEREKVIDSDNSLPEEVRETVNGDINFTELWKINPDIYAWIKVPGTLVDYPVLQFAGDDTFYLSHNVYRQYAFAGSIYTESLNKKDFSDPNTVLYGHNMLNGTMFRSLHNFRDPYFFANNEYIYVYLPERTLTYHIFAAYEYDDRHLLYSFDFNDEDVFRDYLEYAQHPNASMTYNIRELDVTTDDKIITLSTCMDTIDTSRYLVQGVLVKDEPIKSKKVRH